ncbi:MAG: hypothetical protein ABIS29_01230 [Vicinamibacterales bacterium]
MDPKRRREVALGGIAALLIAIAAWSLQRDTAPPSGASAPVAAARPNTTQARPKSPIPEVDLKPLELGRPAPDESTRNPFRFKPRSAPPPPMPSAAIIKQQQQAAEAAQTATGPAEPPPPPRIPLKYIGDMTDPKNAGKKIAILSDARGTYYGREGEVVEGRYRIVRIGVESIELAYLDGRGRQTIRQTGQ